MTSTGNKPRPFRVIGISNSPDATSKEAHGRCPDCGTELTPIRQQRTKRIALWCWKCERYLRLGEARRATRG